MLWPRCVLPILGIYLLLEEVCAAVLPGSLRNKREVSWRDQELFRRLLDDRGHLSVGDAGEIGMDADGRPAHSETFLDSAEHRSLQHQDQVQHQRKAKEKRRKVAPLDSIGSFQMSGFRNRKDEPDS